MEVFRHVVIATVLWSATFLAMKCDWLTTTTGLAARTALVAIGVGRFLPTLFVYVKSIRLQDEFSRRLHRVVLVVAFAVPAVSSDCVDLLHQAQFILQRSSAGLWRS